VLKNTHKSQTLTIFKGLKYTENQTFALFLSVCGSLKADWRGGHCSSVKSYHLSHLIGVRLAHTHTHRITVPLWKQEASCWRSVFTLAVYCEPASQFYYDWFNV